jgi:dihydrofolate reductase
MRKIIVTEFISLDGVIENPHLWHFPFWSDEMGAYKFNEVMTHDAQLLGRTTYEGFAAAWPEYEDDSGFADRMNGMPKYVVSTTLENPTWNNTHVIRDNVAGQLQALKAEPGQDILVAGSGKLINSLMDAGVIDEYRLMVHPVVVGKGQRLFEERETPASLTLVNTEPLPNGVIVLTYAPLAEPVDADEHPFAGQGALADT